MSIRTSFNAPNGSSFEPARNFLPARPPIAALEPFRIPDGNRCTLFLEML
ncbi:MAG: hypothetical protein QM636_26195 [Rhizobium sp.]